MAQAWKTVRVFISSTFPTSLKLRRASRDMHAERDHLVRFVFPKLREELLKRRIHLVDVDLRWGVTEKDVHDGKALDICLNWIRPVADTSEESASWQGAT